MIPWAFFVQTAFFTMFLSYGIASFLIPRTQKRTSKTGRSQPPEIGGPIIFISLAVAFIFLMLFFQNIFANDLRKLFGVVLSSALVFFLGLIDDRYSLHYSAKLFGEIVIASILPLAGFQLNVITNFGGTQIFLPVWIGNALMVLWIVFMMNAVNLIDGLDGLAAGVVAISGVTIFMLGVHDNVLIAALALALAFSLFGILPFNVYPAKIYLGDSGSLLIGYLIGVFSIFFSVKVYAAITILIPFFILFVPILNTALVIISRLRSGRNPFKGDIFHLHYRLLRQGLSHRTTVLFLWMVTASLCALIILRQLLPERPRTVLFLSVILIAYTVLVQFFLAFLKSKRQKSIRKGRFE